MIKKSTDIFDILEDNGGGSVKFGLNLRNRLTKKIVNSSDL